MSELNLESQLLQAIDQKVGEIRVQEEDNAKIVKGYGFHLWRKCMITFVVSWMALLVTFSSTSLMPATPEIAEEFNASLETLNVTNAGVLLAMGYSSLIWGPLNQLFSRKILYMLAIAILCGCTAATAASVNIKMFIAFRILTGLTGTSLLVSGQTILADIFEPVVRGTAVGFFMAGMFAGPAIGPCIGGIIVTFTSWRVLYWLQLGMSGLGLFLALIFIPDFPEPDAKKANSTTPASVIRAFNPFQIFRQWLYPNIFLADLTCGFLSVFQYCLLTSARSIFNPRFHLTTALVSGLFYLAPGAGFLVGSIVGGRFSDHTVKKYIIRRGFRLPQDRLNSGLITLFVLLPASVLTYGWTLQEQKGGMGVPILAAFFGGWGLMGSLNCLNTYVAEALPPRRSEVIAGKYMVQYSFAAGSIALVMPLIEAVGVGWTFTICVALSTLGGLLTLSIAKWGLDMQTWAEGTFGIPGQLFLLHDWFTR
ncbi:major facilitator superfamily domain-containing protein [Aspergillus coremiiformis]|uniref:Major facilitator superfamily domain-containing protein n=1 Tax=Aspergillus coremiiformis TaxID=138285 RepID=A0A5N6ZIF4_9EURO|nr:major facilitator superfamily domain-containing protein [Aspergillus coremiiformis]